MRTIKFRGKTIFGDRWVYGGILQSESGIYIIEPSASIIDSKINKIDPETVGQFTGLTDKDGKEIYEGDILRYTRYNVRGEGIHNETWTHKCRVYWDEDKHAFWHYMKLTRGACRGLLDFRDDRAEKNEIEIIGNIHDNPELLKGE